MFYAIGRHDAIGFSPFGIENIAEPNSEIARCYGVLSRVAPLILENQGRDAIAGVVLDGSNRSEKLQLASYTLEFKLARQWSSAAPQFAAGIIIAVGPDEFLAAGRGLTISFSPNTPGPSIAGLATVEEGTFVDGRWMPGRRLNGDETLSGKGMRIPGDGYSIQRVKLYRYQ
jgi:hypothetical protein